MKYLEYHSGDRMPALGLGTWKSKPGEVYDALFAAVETGYRHFDCAMIYLNEPEIGRAFNDILASGQVKREELWITSKLWCNAHGRQNVIPALRSTLKDLQLDYLDLYLVHWPVALKPGVLFAERAEEMISLAEMPLENTWKGMEDALTAGLARHIGVCNFSIRRLRELIASARVKPEMNQVELHPFLQQNMLLDYCRGEDIHLTAYSPLGSPDRAAQLKGIDEPSLLENPVIVAIADKHGCSPAQVLIKWAIDRGTAVIPKSVNPGRIRQNFESLQVTLDEEDMAMIASLDRHFRYVNGAFWALPGSDYTVAGLWDG